MPRTKSAKKRLRQNEKRRVRNRIVKSALRTQLKKARAVAKPESIAVADAEFRQTVKKLDQAAAKGVIHKNKAARLKSRLSNQLKKAKPAADAPTTAS